MPNPALQIEKQDADHSPPSMQEKVSRESA